jgi:hypothetical protein
MLAESRPPTTVALHQTMKVNACMQLEPVFNMQQQRNTLLVITNSNTYSPRLLSLEISSSSLAGPGSPSLRIILLCMIICALLEKMGFGSWGGNLKKCFRGGVAHS